MFSHEFYFPLYPPAGVSAAQPEVAVVSPAPPPPADPPSAVDEPVSIISYAGVAMERTSPMHEIV